MVLGSCEELWNGASLKGRGAQQPVSLVVDDERDKLSLVTILHQY